MSNCWQTMRWYATLFIVEGTVYLWLCFTNCIFNVWMNQWKNDRQWSKLILWGCIQWAHIVHTVSLWFHLTSGPPDVEQPCDPSLQAWSPELSLYDTNVTSPCPNTEGCTLTLRFLHPVVPHALSLWVTFISSSKCCSITTSYPQIGIADTLDGTIIKNVG